jgi:hypothetical protein
MRYEALQLGQPGQPACPDKYTETSTRITQGSKRVLLQVSKQAVYVQFGIMPQGRGSGAGSVVWQEEEPYLPMTIGLRRGFDAVRVRNYTPGAEAQVLVSFE